MAESRRLGERRDRARRPSRRRRARPAGRCCCASPTCPPPTLPTASRRPTTSSSTVGRLRRRPLRPRTSGCRTGRSAPSSASSTSSGAPRSPARCSRCSGAWGATLTAGLCQLALDRNADAFEEIRPPIAGTHRDAGRHRAAARSSPTTPTHIERDDLWAIPTAEVPLTSIAPRRDPRRRRAADAVHGVHARATGARRARPAGTRGACCGSTSSTRSRSSPARRADEAPGLHDELLARAEGTIAALGLRLPDRRHLRRRPRPEPRTAASTSRCTRRAATSGSRCPRCRGSATTRPGGPTSGTGRPPARAPSWCTR